MCIKVCRGVTAIGRAERGILSLQRGMGNYREPNYDSSPFQRKRDAGVLRKEGDLDTDQERMKECQVHGIVFRIVSGKGIPFHCEKVMRKPVE